MKISIIFHIGQDLYVA